MFKEPDTFVDTEARDPGVRTRKRPVQVHEICDAIVTLHRRREFFIKLRIRIENSAGARVRSYLDYDPGQGKMRESAQSKEEQEKAIKEAKAVFTKIRKGEIMDPSVLEIPNVDFLIEELQIVLASLVPVEEKIEEIKKEMERRAKELPAHAFVESFHGFGTINFARIIGETGDLSNYSGPGKLWARLGLHVFKGRAPSSWKGRSSKSDALTKDEWIKMGYRGKRRAVAFVLGECLTKAKAKNGTFSEIYDREKAKFLQREGVSKKQAHYHAMRVGSKDALRRLWVAWHGLD